MIALRGRATREDHPERHHQERHHQERRHQEDGTSLARRSTSLDLVEARVVGGEAGRAATPGRVPVAVINLTATQNSTRRVIRAGTASSPTMFAVSSFLEDLAKRMKIARLLCRMRTRKMRRECVRRSKSAAQLTPGGGSSFSRSSDEDFPQLQSSGLFETYTALGKRAMCALRSSIWDLCHFSTRKLL